MSTATAQGKQSSATGQGEIWKDSIWGSRQAFIKARVEKEGFSKEAAEQRADVWEVALRDLKVNRPKPFQPK